MPDQGDDKNTTQVPFLQRWSQRKQTSRASVASGQTDAQAIGSGKSEDQSRLPQEQPPHPTQQCLPPIESLHEGSDIGMFLAEHVSESLQRQALRKLFHFGKFNFCDGLDDYAEDYTIFQPLEKLTQLHDTLQDFGEQLQAQPPSNPDNPACVATDPEVADKDESSASASSAEPQDQHEET